MRRLLKIGQECRIRWVDSGAGGYGVPGKRKCRLVFKTTYGKISYLGKDAEIHEEICKKRKLSLDQCRCGYLELTMCSSGKTDTRSELGAIWIHAITEVQTFK